MNFTHYYIHIILLCLILAGIVLNAYIKYKQLETMRKYRKEWEEHGENLAKLKKDTDELRQRHFN